MNKTAGADALAWLPWGADAFHRAAKEGKPVLLHLYSAVSHQSRELELAFGKPGLVEAAARFVCVRADADERPDVAARYAGPAAAAFILGPDGLLFERLLFTDPERFALALADCAKVFAPTPPAASAEKPVWTGAVVEEKADPAVPSDWAEKAVDAAKKAEHKGLECAACHELLLYAAGEWQDGQAQQVLVTQLKELLEGPGWDRKGGGFSLKESEKSLPVNARYCRMMWDAYSLTGLDYLGNAANELTGYLLRDLYDADPGGFRQTRSFDDRRAYFADANAMAVRGIL